MQQFISMDSIFTTGQSRTQFINSSIRNNCVKLCENHIIILFLLFAVQLKFNLNIWSDDPTRQAADLKAIQFYIPK